MNNSYGFEDFCILTTALVLDKSPDELFKLTNIASDDIGKIYKDLDLNCTPYIEIYYAALSNGDRITCSYFYNIFSKDSIDCKRTINHRNIVVELPLNESYFQLLESKFEIDDYGFQNLEYTKD